ncbi:MAG TPA: DUF4139 domain-containing protein [Gemmataceae bacterium]|nr:DUF4139 domain-containing protein [Gemmataceae bacterium]
MRKLFWLAPLALVLAASAFFILKPRSGSATPGPQDPAGNNGQAVPNLPIRNVVLFSSGVGYFQRKGEVDGNSRVDLTFQVRDINDLIKSMVLQDEKGVVSAVSYDSLDPVERTLRSFAVNLTSNPTFGAVLTQMRGERVEVVLQQNVANQPGTITGAIMGIERQKQPSKDGALDAEVLTLWCAEGVRAVKLTDIQRLRFLNSQMENEFRRALDTLALSHDAQKKAVTLNFTGDGKREVKVGYVVENPIWKTSYRLVLDKDGKPFLQGWAIVDNPSDDDWNSVGMALISGRPISFQMDLYQPLYVPRPLVELELFQSLRPVAYDGGIREAKPQLAAGQFAPPGPSAGIGFGGGMPGQPGGGGFGPGGPPGNVNAFDRRQLAESGDRLAVELQQRMDLAKGVQSAATASQLGDFFQYIINSPVTLPRQKSALLPIVNKEIEATRLSIYNPAVHAKFPMLGLKLKNSSGLHLMQGPITVFEGSTYAGDARINDVSPNDERLISFAVDLGTEVEAKSHRPPDRLTKVKIANGVVWTTNRVREEKTYTATNRSGQERMLWIEHPYRAEFEVVSKEKPVERTADVQRFEMKLPVEAKKSVSMTVVEERDVSSAISISNTNDDTIRFFINNALSSPGVKKALQDAAARKAELVKIQQELNHVNQQVNDITQDQARLRANLREMPQTAAAYKRYLEKFDKQETEIEELRQAQKDLQAKELKSRQEFDAFLRNLTVD